METNITSALSTVPFQMTLSDCNHSINLGPFIDLFLEQVKKLGILGTRAWTTPKITNHYELPQLYTERGHGQILQTLCIVASNEAYGDSK